MVSDRDFQVSFQTLKVLDKAYFVVGDVWC
jgi:hypothetical protein